MIISPVTGGASFIADVLYAAAETDQLGRRKLLTARQVSQMTGTALRTLYKWQAKPLHPFPKAIRISEGNKGLRWDETEIHAFIDSLFGERDRQAEELRRLLRGEHQRARRK